MNIVISSDFKNDKNFANQVAETMKALAHPLRLRIIAYLLEGECHVNQIANQLEEPQANISQQLKILRMNNLVHVKKRNGFSYYSLSKKEVHYIIQCIINCNHSEE